ncbi:head-tail adaptor protein, partial [Martelella sp. UBA3392]|uniref:head-tail adaptor protein n=1 Tax=Martelella sp. UBA3392 TaxID=1946834 RepID=UPI0031F5BD43
MEALMRTFDPGAFSARLDLMAPTFTPDGQGGATESWSEVAKLWARVEPVSIAFDE